MERWVYTHWIGEIRSHLAALPRRLTLSSLAVMVGIIFTGAYLVEQAWVRVKHAQERAVTGLALGVADGVGQLAARVNVRLDNIAGLVELDGVGSSLQAMMAANQRTDPGMFGAFVLLDEHADVLATTSDRFRIGAVAPDLTYLTGRHGVGFGIPMRVGGDSWLPMVRSVAQADGYDHELIVFLRMSAITKQIASLPRRPDTLATLFEINGPLIVRLPAVPRGVDPAILAQAPTLMLEGKPSSTSIFMSPLDHIKRLGVAMRVGSLPFGVMAAVPFSTLVRIWWPQAVAVVVLAMALLALMLLWHLELARELSRRREAEARAEEMMREARRFAAQYQLLADYSSDAILEIGFDSVCRYVSPAMEELLGWAPEDLVGKSAGIIIHPDDIDLLREEEQFLRLHCGPIRSLFRARHASGHYLWFEASMQVVNNGGEPDSFVANMRDVSDRIETERRQAQVVSEIARVAATDQLTGLANRWRFDQEMQREWRRAVREELPLSVLLLDVDFFKAYNDTYGHQGGDEALKTVALTVAGALQRSTDIAARWGGEEFVVLLPDTDLLGAIAVAEYIRTSVESLKIAHSGSSIGILTVSAGVAAAYPSRNQAPEPLIAEADANLYEAKHKGRNRVGAPPTEPMIWLKSASGAGLPHHQLDSLDGAARQKPEQGAVDPNILQVGPHI